MTCFSPLKAYRSEVVNPSGKRALTFNPLKAVNSALPIKLPCGQCTGCRFDRAKAWSIRCGHEASMHEAKCFITLTFDDQNVPSDYSIRKEHWQLFMMRVRKHHGAGIRCFGVGEYGDEGGRPHYHGLLFGLDFSADRKLYTRRNGHPVWRSEALAKLWPFGLHEIGSVSNHSAGYVARYCLKKITGKAANDHYFRVSPIDGELHSVQPEFALMSRRPGLGTTWFERFAGDAFPSDFVVVDQRKARPPQFYFRKLSEADQERIARKRKAAAAKADVKANATPDRLRVREEVFFSRVSKLKRPL